MVFKFNVNKGVTLIELLIVTVIISIISGVIIIGTRSSTSDIELFNAKNTIVANINKAKEMALAGISAEGGKILKWEFNSMMQVEKFILSLEKITLF